MIVQQPPSLIHEIDDFYVNPNPRWNEGAMRQVKETSITLMGPYINTTYRPSTAETILQAAKCLRAARWSVQIIPDGVNRVNDVPLEEKKAISIRKRQKLDQELNFLATNSNQKAIEVKNEAGITAAYIGILGDDDEEHWISVNCVSHEAAELVEEQLHRDFLLNRIDHREEHRSFRMKEYQLAVTTAVISEELQTLFLLKRRGTNEIVAEAHCSYQNDEAGVPGPTVQLSKFAAQWWKQSYGIHFLDSIEEFQRDAFAFILNTESEVRLYVCNVKNQKVFEWLQERGYRDVDGIGERLSKSLDEETAAAEAPYIVRQCMGKTASGRRCKVTSENKFPAADPLCYGWSNFCLKHQHQGLVFPPSRQHQAS